MDSIYVCFDNNIGGEKMKYCPSASSTMCFLSGMIIQAAFLLPLKELSSCVSVNSFVIPWDNPLVIISFLLAGGIAFWLINNMEIEVRLK